MQQRKSLGALVSNGANSGLAQLPAYANVALVAFAQPSCSYGGNLNLAGTGLSFSYDGSTLKQAIDALRQRNPTTKVMLAVGGATYTDWSALNARAIANLVNDFGFDGVDIDYEPSNPNCQRMGGTVRCGSDANFISVIDQLRGALPQGQKLISIAAWSVGAYGTGKFYNAQPIAADTGLLVNPLAARGNKIDLLNVMSYDASNAYDPVVALTAYRAIYSGQINMGVEVPPEAWGGHVYTVDAIKRLGKAVMSDSKAGMMLWSVQKQTNQATSPSYPSANLAATTICQILGLPSCSQPINPFASS
ncbi:chitinase Chi60, putative [Acanthamoeba castellanii str. Neff]|uniref:Chitinase Chi60, putative n=1 Tax=Acanthamoeba castellanii (strain ATCC 30010 / Neff) TaxID=1257118 RepID=L8HA43_ACACF|nr:chitinase Chi60, putative [Acanthamoeba castellanii str. Neff]ELR22409.1 chitinase Chi60, putative [Acanthamoeba castellanii str. Neff]